MTPIADILARPGFTSSTYEHAEARLELLAGQAIAELQQNIEVSSPQIRKARETRLSAWPVISSTLFTIADSDAVRAISGIAGLNVDWTLSTAEAFSHRTRNRAYQPKLEAAYKELGPEDQEAVLSIIAAELAKRYPSHLESIRNNLARVGWTLKTTPESESRSGSTRSSMKRDRELQKLILLQVRDGNEPPELCNYSEADQVYNAALLINDGLVEGKTIRGTNGEYVSTIMTELTSAGHDFLDGSVRPTTWRGESNLPPEIAESFKKFRTDNPDASKCAFIMMRFGTTKAHDDIVNAIRKSLEAYGMKALRADDKEYHDDLFANILTYIYGCSFGIAVYERIEQDEFNPNVSLEVGYMMGLKRPVLLLKDRTLKNLNTDLVGKLYKDFDPQNIEGTICGKVDRWLKDKSIV